VDGGGEDGAVRVNFHDEKKKESKKKESGIVRARRR